MKSGDRAWQQCVESDDVVTRTTQRQCWQRCVESDGVVKRRDVLVMARRGQLHRE